MTCSLIVSEFPAVGETLRSMFPAIFMTLIIGSVILMIFTEFKEEIIPFVQKILSVPAELERKSSLYLADPSLRPEYSSIVNIAEKELWLALPRIEKKPMSDLLHDAAGSLPLRIILGNKTDAEQIKGLSGVKKREVEIANRPRINFKLMLIENVLAVGSANFLVQDLQNLHDLVIISTQKRLLREARAYFLAFVNEYSNYPQDKQKYSLSSVLPQNTKSVFINTSNGLNDLVKDLLSSAQQSILLVSPYITNDVAEFILRIISDEVQARFITWVDWHHWVNEQSDPEALEMFLSNRILIESCPNLHANCIIVDNKAAIISSQNLTKESWTSRDEAGIYTKNPDLIQAILERIDSWQPRKRFTLEAFEQEINKLDAYQTKEPAKPPSIPEKEEEEALPMDIGEMISPPLLGFSTLPQIEELEREVPIATPEPLPDETPAPAAKPLPEKVFTLPEKLIQDQTRLERFWMKDVVFVGKKRLMDYVWACLNQVKKNQSVTIKARGRLIYRAVDVAELLRSEYEPNLIMDDEAIRIDTYYPKGKKSKWGGISEIEITLQKKN
jgi:DNA-binding protein Alba